MATNYYNSFIQKLEEIFMMDHAELDFGIYRIMNQKRTDIKKFLERDLLTQVKQILKENSQGVSEVDKARMAELERQLGTNIDSLPDSIPAVQEYKQLQAKMERGADLNVLENEVYSHLTTFFSRYYDEGDFISKRRYKDNTYAIPYNGEEVKLHWANADQYYIKTSEYFRNYTFLLPAEEGNEKAPRKKVHFVLKDASTEQNNNKTQNNMERRFAIYMPKEVEDEGNIESLFDLADDEQTVEITSDGELNIYFTYDLMPKATKQKDLCAKAIEVIEPLIPEEFKALLTVKVPTKDNPNRTLLEKHLTDYTAKNSFDYFIHKDLGGFLRRELDFYIKNEVLHIDDLDSNLINEQLAKVKAIKGVGEKIVRMLASLEDFQKKLWLKKKFVVQCDYCITLDRVPESMYEEICANDAQREEWVRLFAIDEIKADLSTEAYSVPLTINFLKQNPFLVLDTAFFPLCFKHKLLASIDNLEEHCGNILINSDNFQALQLLQEKYRSAIKGVYIDPPYNTDATPIVYKNSYKDSSWLSLMQDRLSLSAQLIKKDGFHSVAIDDTELHNLYKVMESVFWNDDLFQCIVNHYPGSGTGRSNVSKTHEYNIFAVAKDLDLLRGNKIDERQRTRGFCRSGTGDNNHRFGRPNSFYAVLIDDSTKQIVGVEPPPPLEEKNYPRGKTEQGYLRIYPLGSNGVERCWSLGYESAKEAIKNGMLQCTANNTIIRLYNDESDWELLPSLWVDSKYSAVTNGTNLLTKIFGKSGLFSFPKSLYTVMTAVYAGTYYDKDSIILDYFSGSGTTAHAVMQINREEGGNRKYVMCEMGEYFDRVTRKRVEKVIYSTEWNAGKPVSRDGISQCFKYIRLEQYEDTLNNLNVGQASDIFETAEDENFKESYMLGYMMDTETKGSLFNLKWFVNPFAMTLKTTKDNELVETNVDMVETFNFLIGLNVETIHWHQDDAICVVEGTTHRRGEKTLVIWRDCTRVDNEKLNRFFERMDYSTQTREFDVIYVNGDNTLPNLRRDEDHWKVVLIEEEFQKRMFENT